MSDTKEQILLAALRLFARDGYEAVSVSQIAGALGMTKGALYKHYKNKQDIFDSIVARMEQLDAIYARQYQLPEGTIEEMEEAYRHASLQQIVAFSRAQFHYWTEEAFPSCFRRLLTLEQYRNEAMHALYQQYLAAGPLGYMIDLFRSLRIPDADQMALAFYGPMHLLYSCYDGAEEKQAVFVLLEEHLDRMYKTLKVGGEL